MPGFVAPFVGREGELDLLTSCLVEAKQGRGRLVTLCGEPGIGKTTLLGVFAREAECAGAVICTGRWYENQGLQAYTGFLEAVGSLPAELVRSAAGRMPELAPALKLLMPEWADILPPSKGRTTDIDTPFQAREALSRLFLEAAEQSVVCLALDDVHQADSESIAVLEHLIRRGSRSRLVVLAAYRDTEVGVDHPLSHAVSSLKRDRLTVGSRLSPLGRREVACVIEGMTGKRVTMQFAESIRVQTAGNPLFVVQLVRSLHEEQRLEDSGLGAYPLRPEELQLPDTVRELVRARAARLPRDVRTVLELAAVLGQRFRYAFLDAVTDYPRERLVELVEEAEQAGLLGQEAGPTGAVLSFTHPLVRQAVYDQLSEVRRQVLHARAAKALQAFYRDAVQIVAPEIAYHLVRARDLGDPGPTLQYCRMAGQRQIALFANEEAISHYETALKYWEIAGAGERVRADLLSDLGFAYGQTNRPEDGIRCYDEAIRIYDRLGETREAANARRKTAVLLTLYGRPADAVRYYEEALPGLGDEVSLEHTSGLSGHALALMTSGRLGQAGPYIERALKMAQQLRHPRAEGTAEWAAAVWNSWDLGDPAEAPGNFERSLRLFREAGSFDGLSRTATDGALSLYIMGRTDEALKLLEEAEELACRFSPATLADVMGIKLLVSVHRGEWAAADRYWQRYETIAGNASSALNVVARRARALQAYFMGDAEEAYHRVSGSDPLYNSPLRAYLLLKLGRPEEALHLWQMILTRLPPSGHGGLWLLFAMPTVTGLREMGRLPEPEAWYGALRAHGDWQPDWLVPSVELARLAADGSGEDDPVEILSSAIRRYDAGSFAPLAAICRLEAARALAERAAAGDKSRASSEVASAAEEFHRLGMKGFAEEADALLRRLRVGRPPTDASRDGLSEREVEVLELVAMGLTNAEIAEELSLSPRTVERHIGNILCKLQAPDRTRAAVLAVERGLVRKARVKVSGEVSLDVRNRNARMRRRRRQ